MSQQDAGAAREVRLERLHPDEVHAAMAEAPVAWVPLGALEFHARHLPFGTDGFSAAAVVERAARRVGGVVLPWSALTIGTLALEWSFRYEAELVEATLRQTIEQLAEHGARVVVVHTGHGPLDLLHLIKRVCNEVEGSGRFGEDFRAYGLCYLELNAALGAGLGSDWPVAIDHASIVETSWMMAIRPDLVQLQRLPRGEALQGVYGPDPHDGASATLGETQLEACARLLAERAAALLDGGRLDALADLRTFVERYWAEPLLLSGRAGASGAASVVLTNPAPVSRYLTSLLLSIDGQVVAATELTLRNDAPGEPGGEVSGDRPAAESGFYVRRSQSAILRLPQAVSPGGHQVRLVIGPAGVTTTTIEQRVVFA